MKKCLLATLLSVLLIMPAAVRANDAMKQALSVIPADAVAFVCVPNVKQLDTDFQGMEQRLGFAGMIAPPFNSLQGILQTFLRVGEGFNPDGPAVVVIMPANNWMEMMMKQALILPATNPRALLESMGATAGEGGVWNASINGQPAVAMEGKSYIVLAQIADVAKTVASGEKTIAPSFNEHDLTALEGLDLAIWIDGNRLLTVFKQQIDGFINMAAMMQSGQGPGGAAQAEMTKKNLRMLVDGAASIGIGVGLGDDGLTMRMGFRAKAGSELATSMKVRPTTESLLRGLPDSDYLFAFGATMDPDAMRKSADQMDGYFAMAETMDGIDMAQLSKLKSMVKEWAPMSTGLRGVVTAIAPGTDGMFGAALVFDTVNSEKWAETFAGVVETAMKLPKEDAEGMDEQAKELLEALKFKRDVETVAGAKVHHLTFDVSAVEDMDEEDQKKLHTLVGSDGITVRTAAVGTGSVVMTFGGGSSYFAKVVEQTQSKAAPLEGDPGIQAVNKRGFKERSGVGYFDVDRIVRWIGGVITVVEDGDEAFPVKMAKVDAPVALCTTGGDGWQTNQLYVPAELMIAAKNAAMGAMGGQPPEGE